MAYVNQEKKQAVQALLKKAIPTGWKWSLRVLDHSTLSLTIYSAPVNLLTMYGAGSEFIAADATHIDVNPYHYERHFTPEGVELFRPIFEAMSHDNYNNSDLQADHHDVGHYVSVGIGRWNKPFSVA